MATSERLSVEMAGEHPASGTCMGMYFRRTERVGKNSAVAPSVRMREKPPNDRGRFNEECFRSQREALYSAPENTLLSDDPRKSPCNDDTGRKIMTVPPRLHSPSLFMTPNARIPTISSNSVLLARSLTLTTPPPPARTGFSAGTVIALSTVLPVIILLLLGVIIHLLRTRGRPRPVDSPKDQEENFPMANIRPPDHSFDVLEHRAVSPFNISLHDLVVGKSANSNNPDTADIRSHVSSDSGHAASNAHIDQPIIPPLAIARAPDPDPPPTPVLPVRYPSRFLPGGSKPGNRTSIYVDRTSIDTSSATASTVVFAHPALTEEGASVGRPSREESVRRLSLGTRHNSGGDLREDSPTTAGPSSGRVSAAETLTTGADTKIGPQGLKLLGIGPPARAHSRSQSQPASTYSLPSLQLSPRMRTKHSPGEVRVRSPLGSTPVQEPPPRLWSQRIHSHRASASLSTPISASSLPSHATLQPSAVPPREQERRTLSIVVPPRLGAPIKPVAELAALQTPSTPPQPTPRANTPRMAHPRTPASPLSIQDALGLNRVRGMSDLAEPSPETRERILQVARKATRGTC
ncbi:hypothetical protein OPQ81_005408 [Rhizoctonia solani]|nr:hypothetical protein OPQ81_005408 [Rhizoctonia solani]